MNFLLCDTYNVQILSAVSKLECITMFGMLIATGVTGDPRGAGGRFRVISKDISTIDNCISFLRVVEEYFHNFLHFESVNNQLAHKVMISEDSASSNSTNHDIFLPSSSKRCRVLSNSEKSSSSSLSDLIIPFSIRRRRIESDSESEFEDDGNNDEDNSQEEVNDTNWHIPSCNQPKITFSNSSGINTHHSEIFYFTEPHSFYCLFVSNEIFEIIANQTNIYAAKIVSEQRSRRLDKWIETNPNEIKRFFGLIIWMGLVRLPKIHLYWSRNEEYRQEFPSTVMSRNRFELLLRFIHFSNNEENDPNNRLSKIIHIIDILNRSFKEYYNPDEILCVDESLVPFRYGIKMFKLCSGAGYTYSFQIYTGKEKNRDKTAGTISSKIVMNLCKNILGKGHTVCTDNWYTSVDLAEELIAKNTHLVGTLRKNRRGNSVEVVSKKLKRGELIARENKSGITILKWKDKRDVLMLSTKHSAEMATVHKKFYSCEKPKMVADYNLGKSSVDLSDQMIAYSSPLRKTLKWYRKLAIKLLLNTCMVNAMVLFKQVTRKNIQIPDFRMKVAMYLTKCRNDEVEVSISPRESFLREPRHELKAMPGKARTVRRFCKSCYQKNSKKLGRIVAKNCSKKVVTYCGDCDGSPFLCLECFNTTHRNVLT